MSMLRARGRRVLLPVLLLCLAGLLLGWYVRGGLPALERFTGRRSDRKTVRQVMGSTGPSVNQQLIPDFRAAGVSYPPRRIVLLALKKERVMELWASDGRAARRIRSYPVLAASGVTGPKLRQGDRQVPEGVYRIIALNPNSSYHLSLKLDYPNAYDRARAREEGRTRLGGEIFIHGGRASIGCLAMGDEAAEELFILAGRTGIENVTVIIAPVDFRLHDYRAYVIEDLPWTGELYGRLDEELKNTVTENGFRAISYVAMNVKMCVCTQFNRLKMNRARFF